MKYKNILVTGGAGFIGSTICIQLKEYYSDIRVIAFDNLSRKGSELNLPRLEEKGVNFIKGDVRNKEDFSFEDVDLIIECSAEPSVLAGLHEGPEYVLDTNLGGALHCFEHARKSGGDVIFLSTSRVYPIELLNGLSFVEADTRFSLNEKQAVEGVTKKGISEKFPITGYRSLYGATKLSAEFVLEEFIKMYNMNAVVNRFSVVAGPWQMGKTDQGVVTFWIAQHVFNNSLAYIGFGGKGKQVRDVLHVDDLFETINMQLGKLPKISGRVYNIGGGEENSFSLCELTNKCKKIVGKNIPIKEVLQQRVNDVRIYYSDNTKFQEDFNWKPTKNIDFVVQDIYKWISDNKDLLGNILS